MLHPFLIGNLSSVYAIYFPSSLPLSLFLFLFHSIYLRFLIENWYFIKSTIIVDTKGRGISTAEPWGDTSMSEYYDSAVWATPQMYGSAVVDSAVWAVYLKCNSRSRGGGASS